jgi:hypothetical protein
MEKGGFEKIIEPTELWPANDSRILDYTWKKKKLERVLKIR